MRAPAPGCSPRTRRPPLLRRPGRPRARPRVPRLPGEGGGDAAAQGGVLAEMRRFEGQTLPGFVKKLLQLGKRGAAARRDHELGRLVADEAGMGAGVEQLAARLVAVEILGSAAAQPQGRAMGGCLPDSPLEIGEGQNRGSSACGSLPPLTRMRPYSAQRASVGTALPGLSRPRGSKARFTARKASRTSGRSRVPISLL